MNSTEHKQRHLIGALCVYVNIFVFRDLDRSDSKRAERGYLRDNDEMITMLW